MMLADVAVGRDNHFNLIRFVAAMAVLVSHGVAIVLGPGVPEPLEAQLGYTLGEIAVDVFFASSGFLVCGSLLRLSNVADFSRARMLRIWPGLLASLVLVSLVLGPLVSRLPLTAYFSSGETWTYLVRNAVLFGGIQHQLPGVFVGQPLSGVVNGSLWTLPFEVWCYALLATAWIILRRIRQIPFGVAMLLATSGSLVLFHVTRLLDMEIHHAFRLLFMFFSGASLFVYRGRVPMSRALAACALALMIAGAVSAQSFAWIYPLCLAYLVLYAAYLPGRAVRGFNRLGDYSYGLYIYAFPVQQTVALLIPETALPAQVATTAAMSLLLAAISWHLIEKPFLDRKRRLP